MENTPVYIGGTKKHPLGVANWNADRSILTIQVLEPGRFDGEYKSLHLNGVFKEPIKPVV